MKSIDEGERSGAYTPDQAKRRRQAETEGELAHAGISRPKEDFRKAFEEITELHGRAIGNGGISDKEFEKRKKELEERASGAMTEDTKTVSPVAAMAAGSKEAYSMMVNAQLNDPKMQAQQEANKTLKAIEKAIVDKKASPGNTLGF
jgi:hypothetical protein